MKKKILQLLVLVSVSLSVTSCVTTLYMEGEIPAATSVTVDQWKVVVLNRYNADLLKLNQDKNIEVYRDGAKNALTGAAEAVFTDPSFSLLEAGPQEEFVSKTNTDYLTEQQVRALYKKTPSHLYLALDNLDAYIEQEGVSAVQEGESRSKNANYNLIVKTNWSLYDSTGVLVDRATITNQTPYQSRSVINGQLAIGPSMAKAGAAVQMLAFEAGLDYWERLYPQVVPMERDFYLNQPYIDSYMSLTVGDYDKAIAQLLPLTEDSKAKKAGRAAYNLAVVYESAGNLEEASKWATVAAEKGDKKAKLLIADWQQLNKLIEQRYMDGKK